MNYLKLVIILVACVQANRLIANDDLTSIRYNPFKVPVLKVEVNTAVSSVLSVPAGTLINLRAILFDGNASLVQVGDELIGIGEVTQGYRLITVNEHSAVFIKQGKKIHISIHDDKSEQSDE